MKNIKLIAETAWHHDGDFEFMNNLVEDLTDNSKADYIKLHITLDFDEYMLPDHSGYELLKGKALTEKQWETLIDKINASEKELMLLFNDIKAIKFGMQFNPSLVEIHSVCLNDIHLLSAWKEYNDGDIPIVLGVGGSTLYEIETAINYLDSTNIILMHGFQNYPTKYEDVNFNRMRKIMNLYPNLKHGYADHTAWNEPNNNLITVMGAALGMEFVEKHVTNVSGVERTDWQAAVSIDQFNNLTKDLKILDQCNGDGALKLNQGEKDYSKFGPNKKAGFIKERIYKGDLLKAKNIEFKRTGNISESSQLDVIELIGKKSKGNLAAGCLINNKDFE